MEGDCRKEDHRRGLMAAGKSARELEEQESRHYCGDHEIYAGSQVSRAEELEE